MMEVASAGWKYVANASPLTKKSLDEAEEVISSKCLGFYQQRIPGACPICSLNSYAGQAV